MPTSIISKQAANPADTIIKEGRKIIELPRNWDNSIIRGCMDNLYLEEKFKNIDKELHEHEQRIALNEKKIAETDKLLAASMQSINSSLDSLSKLPEVMSDVSGTIAQMGATMELMQAELKRNTEEIANVKNDIAKQHSKISTLDKEGKINFRLWLKDNWLKIVLGIGTCAALLEYIAYRFPK